MYETKTTNKNFLGFLSFNDPDLNIPGNAGLKDQVLALKWIKLNCIMFGGDPDNITVFGESAGAASTHYMMLTDQTKGLFHKAILMSGSVLCPWAKAPSRNWAYRLAKSLGYQDVNNDRKVLEFLRSVNGEKIVKVIRSVLTDEERKNRIFYAFGPVIEPYISKDCVIPIDPRVMMRIAWGNHIPIMIGGTSFEGLFCYFEIKKYKNILEEINDCEYLVPMELSSDRYSERCKELGRKLKTLHFGEKNPGKQTVFEYLDLLSYKYILHGLHRTIQSRLKYSTCPTYLYRFDFDSSFFNHVRIIYCGNEVRSGVSHADDLSYLFLNVMSEDLNKSSPEYKTIQRMIGMWTQFALKTNPNHDTIRSVNWVPLEKNAVPYKCLNISREIEIIDLPEMDKLLGWDDLYDKDLLI